MSNDPPANKNPDAYRYDAFISYRHVEPDRKWAKWLHAALETYRVPRELVTKGFPSRLTRVFRDEEELPANADLSKEITTALDQSRFLIVICSPRAPQSKWVNSEVEHFRKLGRHDRILALLIEGEPRESFPPALTAIRTSITDPATGQSREEIEEVEPLAADVRPDRSDAKAHVLRGHARLRLMACILGCRFDDLRQREAERRIRRARIVGAGLAALVLVMTGLTTFALFQRAEAVLQRQSAEAFGGLIAEDIVQYAVDAQDPAAADLLARAANRVPDRFNDQPKLLAEVSVMFGQALMRAGNAKDALSLFEQAKLTAQSANLDSNVRLAIDNGLADARLRQSITDADLKNARARVVDATRDRGARDPLVMTLRNQFAGLLKNAPGSATERAANLDEAEQVYTAVLTDRIAVLGPDDLDTLVTRHNLSIVDLQRCRVAFRALGDDPPEADPADRAGAIAKFKSALTSRIAVTQDTRKALGDRHPQTIATWSDEVALKAEAGRLEPTLLTEALDEYPVMLDSLRTTLGFDHWRSLEVTGRYAQALGWAARIDDAIHEWWIVVEGGRAVLGVGNGLTLGATSCLVSILEQHSKLERAEAILLRSHRDAIAAADKALTVKRAEAIRAFYLRHGRNDDAERWKVQ